MPLAFPLETLGVVVVINYCAIEMHLSKRIPVRGWNGHEHCFRAKRSFRELSKRDLAMSWVQVMLASDLNGAIGQLCA